ncbi:hypothetical protein [Paenibacillus sp. FSL W7-1287]|nr:hypothetical protein [Paenibacillus camelliae]
MSILSATKISHTTLATSQAINTKIKHQRSLSITKSDLLTKEGSSVRDG